MPSEALFIGLISGTSLDGIDAVLVDLSADAPRLLQAIHTPYSQTLLEPLRTLSLPGDNEIDRLGELDRQVAIAFAGAVAELLSQADVEAHRVTAIGSHGQTARHRPSAEFPFTLQIGDPNTLAEMTGITTVADFRRRDMAAGGEGAPLVPAFHQAVLQSDERARVALNLGGIANITCLPPTGTGPVRGYDTGPANTLMDAWISRHRDMAYDQAGAWAGSGRLIGTLLRDLLADPYFSLTPPKSTGTEYFNLSWLEARLGTEQHDPADVQHTLAELTAVTVTDAIAAEGLAAAEVLVCGGGAHNRYLMQRLQDLLPAGQVRSTAEYGLDPDWVEAMAFAWLAQRTLNGLSGNLPSVTGARRAVTLGAIYPAGG
ncbi:MAG: anhydro-N-acetylmuramic acid kinase [Candidatus Thiodiazotropha sp.]